MVGFFVSKYKLCFFKLIDIMNVVCLLQFWLISLFLFALSSFRFLFASNRLFVLTFEIPSACSKLIVLPANTISFAKSFWIAVIYDIFSMPTRYSLTFYFKAPCSGSSVSVPCSTMMPANFYFSGMKLRFSFLMYQIFQILDSYCFYHWTLEDKNFVLFG